MDIRTHADRVHRATLIGLVALLFGDASLLLVDVVRLSHGVPGAIDAVMLGGARLLLVVTGLSVLLWRDEAKVKLATVAVAAVANAFFAVPIGISRGQPDTMLITIVVTTIGAAVLIPWSWRVQAVVAVFTVLALVTGISSVTPVTPVLVAVSLCAIVASIVLCGEMSRSRGELLRAEEETEAAEAEALALEAHLEDDVRSRVAELAAAESELEQLCRSAAHDLRPPLRTMAGYAEMLREGLPGNSGGLVEGLAAIGSLAQQMAESIDVLRSEVRSTQKALAGSGISLSDIVREEARRHPWGTVTRSWAITGGIYADEMGEAGARLVAELAKLAAQMGDRQPLDEIRFGLRASAETPTCAISVAGQALAEPEMERMRAALQRSVSFRDLPPSLAGVVAAAHEFAVEQHGRLGVEFPRPGVAEFWMSVPARASVTGEAA